MNALLLDAVKVGLGVLAVVGVVRCSQESRVLLVREAVESAATECLPLTPSGWALTYGPTGPTREALKACFVDMAVGYAEDPPGSYLEEW